MTSNPLYAQSVRRVRTSALLRWSATLVAAALLLPAALHAQSGQPALTTVKDTVYRPDGTLASGSVVITWDSFLTMESKPIFGGSKTLSLNNGALLVALTPNVGAAPSGTSYTVRYYQSGAVFAEEFWVVPASNPVAPPAPPAVTQVGASGSTTYCYWISAVLSTGETSLSQAGCTGTGHNSLSPSNFNRLTWTPLAGAISYRIFRTGSAAPPAGTGNYLVASSSLNSFDDTSNSLQPAAIPEINTTDPRTLQQVRVTVPPSSSMLFSASQVTGTAIVSNPVATQTITAPTGSGIPLQLRGHSSNGGDILQVFVNQSASTPVAAFSSTGALTTSISPTISNLQEGSILFSSNGGQIAQNNTNLYWDSAGSRLRVGPRSGMSTLSQNALGLFRHSISVLNPPAGFSSGLGAVSQSDNAASYNLGAYSVTESAHATGNRTGAIGLEADAYHTGAGTITDLIGLFAYADNSGPLGGNATRVDGMASVAVQSGASTTTDLAALRLYSNAKFAGTILNNYGLKIEDQTAGTNNWALKTGAGRVQLGGPVTASRINNIRYADQFTGVDAGAQIAAAILDLPATGGTVDARGLEGPQSIGSTLHVGSAGKPVTLLLGAAAFTLTGAAQLIVYDGSRIVGLGRTATTLAYGGSGTALQTANPSNLDDSSDVELRGFRLTRTGPAGTTVGVSLQGIWKSTVEGIWIENFAVGINLDGTGGGCYLNTILRNELTANAIGIKLTGATEQTANRNSIRENRITGAVQGIYGAAGGVVASNEIAHNDVEEFLPGTSFGIDYHGDNSIIMGNWVEHVAAAADAATGIRLRGAGNLLINNKYSIVASGGTATQLDRDNTLPNSYMEESTGGPPLHLFADNVQTRGVQPELYFFESDQTNKNWKFVVAGGDLYFQRVADNGDTVDTQLTLSNGLGLSVNSGMLRSDAADTADTGFLRLGNSQSIAAESAPSGVDGTILFNSSSQWELNSPLAFDGATVDANKSIIAVADPTATRTFTIPNANSNPVQPATCFGTDKVSAISSSGVITCSPDQGGSGSGGDHLRVEDGDNTGTFTAMTDADFDDGGDIDFQRTAGTPDSIVAVVRPNSVELSADTTGNYVGSVADGTGIDGAASGEGAVYTPSLDLTEINSHTFGDNSASSLVQTFDPTGSSNPAWSYSNGVANLSAGTLQQGGTAVALQNVTLTAGNGLTGGGDLSASRSFDVAVSSPIELSGDAVACSTCTTASNTQSWTNKTLDAEAAGNVLLLPQRIEFQAAGCDGSTASAAFDLPSSNAPAKSCQGTSPHRFGTLDFADGAGALTSNVRYLLPADWTTTGGADIRFIWSSSSTSTSSAVWTVQTSCAGDGEDTANPTYNSLQTVSDANNATANTRNSASITGINMAGCAAGETLYLKVGRDPGNGSDTLAATAELHSIELTIRRQI